MQITETSAEGLVHKFEVTVLAADIETRINNRLAQIAKTINLPGFRPGKVPVGVIKQRYGSSILGEVLEETVNDSSAEAIQTHNLRPALQPKIEINSFNEGTDLTYSMQIEVLPEIAAPDLKTIKLERLQLAIPDTDIDGELERLSERYRKTETVTDGSITTADDVAVIDFVGSIDGVEFAGGAAQGHALDLSSSNFIAGFAEQLVGKKTGEHVAVKVTFPADYGAEHLAGKEAVFEVDVTEVKRNLPPVIDESLAEQLGMENLDEVRTAIGDQIKSAYSQVGQQKLKRELLDQLAEKFKFDVPPGMVDLEFNSIWKQFEDERERAKEAGTYTPEEGKTEDETKAEYQSIAERRVRLGLLLAEIGKNANIQVTQDEINRAVAAQARNYPGQEKMVVDYYKNSPEALQSLRAPIYEDKVVDHIVEQADVTDKALPPTEYLAAAHMDDDGQGAV